MTRVWCKIAFGSETNKVTRILRFVGLLCYVCFMHSVMLLRLLLTDLGAQTCVLGRGEYTLCLQGRPVVGLLAAVWTYMHTLGCINFSTPSFYVL